MAISSEARQTPVNKSGQYWNGLAGPTLPLDQRARKIRQFLATDLLHHLLELGFEHADGMVATLLAERGHPVHKRAAHKGEISAAG